MRRLYAHAAVLGLDLSDLSESFVADEVRREMSEKRLTDSRIRVTFYDERSGSIWPGETPGKTGFSLISGDLRPISQNFTVGLSPYSVNRSSPLAGIKSCSYLDKIMALDEARSSGFDECVMTNEQGSITSAAMANIFWLKDDTLYTPSLTTGCLAGTTREFVLENIDCREVEARIEVLHNADAVFLTSAGLGVIEVSAIGERVFEKSDHPVLGLLPPRGSTGSY